jgi:hypothetical protein
MSSAELTEWLAFYTLEPWGGELDYLGDAIVASTVHNVQRGKKAAMKPEDFIPKFRHKAQTISEQINIAAMLTTALGGTVGGGE